MSTENTRTPVTRPTPENVAESLTSDDNVYHDGYEWTPSLTADGNVVRIGITPTDAGGMDCDEVQFRAVVVEGEETPIVLERPDELGLSWDDGGDLLALTREGIRLYPRGMDEWQLDPAEARDLAAQLAAMADAYEAAVAQKAGGEGR